MRAPFRFEMYENSIEFHVAGYLEKYEGPKGAKGTAYCSALWRCFMFWLYKYEGMIFFVSCLELVRIL